MSVKAMPVKSTSAKRPGVEVDTVLVPVPSSTTLVVDVFVAAKTMQRLEIGDQKKEYPPTAEGKLQFVETLSFQTGKASTVKVSNKHSDDEGASWESSLVELYPDLVQFGTVNRRVVVTEDDRDAGTNNHIVLHFLWWGPRAGTLPTSSEVSFPVPSKTDIFGIAYSDASYDQRVELSLNDTPFYISGKGSTTPHNKLGSFTTNTEDATTAVARFSYKGPDATSWSPSKAWNGSLLSLGDYREITAITEDWVDDDYNDTLATFMWLQPDTSSSKQQVSGVQNSSF